MNPYLSIWLRPKKTFDQVRNSKKSLLFSILSFSIFATIICLDSYLSLQELVIESKDKYTLALLLSYLVGVRLLIPFLILIPLLLTGVLSLHSKTNYPHIVTIIAFALIPMIILLAMQLTLPFFGETTALENIPFAFRLLFWIWTLRLLASGIAKYKNISLMYAGLLVLLIFIPCLYFDLIIL